MRNNDFNRRLKTKIALTVCLSVIGFSLLYYVIDTMFNGMLVDFMDKNNFKFVYYVMSNKSEIFAIGIAVVVIISWYISQSKISRQLENIFNSIDIVINKDETLIELPSDFKDVENKLNKIKYENIKNERIAKEAEQRKNDLVVYLAHDLKTPLTSIIGYLNLLHDEQKIPEEMRQKYLSISLEKSLRLEDLINEFFEITRFNMQNMILEKSNFNLSLMLEQLADEMYPQIKESNLVCKLNLIPNLYIEGDRDKLARVFDNLLKNAINYSYNNSVITITSENTKTGVNIAITNSGVQIPAPMLESIFEKFYRLDSARTSRTGGSGLGLAIAKEIVELHNGRIKAESNEIFTQFTVSLPIET